MRRVVGDVAPRPQLCVRAEVEVEGVSVLEWFSRQHGLDRFYWSGRDGEEEAAGAGIAVQADEVDYSTAWEALTAVRRSVDEGPADLRYYGGMCFDPLDDRTPMEGFGRFRFVAPRLELRRTGGRTILALTEPAGRRSNIQSLRAEVEALASEAASLSTDTVALQPVRRILTRVDRPNRNQWTEMVGQVMDTMRREGLGKIVLSRKSELTMSGEVDPAEILRRVRAGRGGTYDFCFESGGRAFVGSSPECLYRRRDREIRTEAMAGTCPIGETDRQTDDLRQALLASAKEAEEHEYVFQDVRTQLQRICDRCRVVGERDVLALTYVQHFVSRFEGRLKAGLATAEVIDALHPTAAVGGYPQAAALEQIRRIERHGRGWYAGPVGWVGRRADEFAVGIRSCMIEGPRLTLYAGAGIVEASDAAAEWDETEAKMRHFLEVLE